MSPASDRLYNLLPAIYRIRDEKQGEALRALLAIIEDQLSEVEADIAGLYANWFIETCDEWVVSYIGDLLGVHDLTTAFSQRAYIANTLFYRRRKGTAHVLSILARDVTGWSAHVVEFFERLQTTQYLNHRRLFNTTPDLRGVDALNLLDTPFDNLPHTVDVRHIYNRRGKHNIPNIGIFLWRLQNYPLLNAIARQAEPPHGYGYHFSSLGNPAPLFNEPSEGDVPDEQLVPGPIRPLDFYFDLKTYQEQFGAASNSPENSRYYGPQRSLQITRGDTPIPPRDVMCKNLSDWARPPAGKVAVDVVRGRITFPAGEEPSERLAVSYSYGFSADIGGGPYNRQERIAEVSQPVQEYSVGSGKTYAILSDAIDDWVTSGQPPAVIRIYDSATYDDKLVINLPKGGWLVLDCENGERPTLVSAPLRVKSAAASEAETAAFTISGLVVEGNLEVEGKLNLTIVDSTLVPGQALDEDGYPKYAGKPSLMVSGTDVVDLNVVIARSIVGPLELPEECRGLVVTDSIIDAPLASGATDPSRPAIAGDATGSDPGPVTTLERVTVFGGVHVKKLSRVSEVIFTHPIVADQHQVGCVRFSSIAAGSSTPHRFRCQPDLAIKEHKKQLGSLSLLPAEQAQIEMCVRPQFTSIRYGAPTYAQLSESCAEEIKIGAENGSEMGVFNMLQQPQRLANLRIVLEEYLRFGLEAGIFLVTYPPPVPTPDRRHWRAR
ncbi:MAG: hypothetical protein JXB07_07190 [Anaerolineae bacterium]|nr:hypothetical protein [Anaerolineae bacterium]